MMASKRNLLFQGCTFFYKLQWSKNFTFDVGYRWCISGYFKTPEMTSEQKIPLGQGGPFWFLGFSDFEAKLQDVLFPGLNGLAILQILIHHSDAFGVFIYDRNLGNHGESKWIESVFYVSIVFLHWHGRKWCIHWNFWQRRLKVVDLDADQETQLSLHVTPNSPLNVIYVVDSPLHGRTRERIDICRRSFLSLKTWFVLFVDSRSLQFATENVKLAWLISWSPAFLNITFLLKRQQLLLAL